MYTKENSCYITGETTTMDIQPILNELDTILARLRELDVTHFYIGCRRGFELCALEHLIALQSSTYYTKKITVVFTKNLQQDTHGWSDLMRERLDDALDSTDEEIELNVQNIAARDEEISERCRYVLTLQDTELKPTFTLKGF